MPAWLNDAVFYEIYPQSFNDTNGDGIGDINGITEKLDYVKSLGCNALWLNPCFDSPFVDAGYDVRDFKKVAPRYGSNEDLARCFEQAHKRGLRVLLDLVAGHSSEEHEWFAASKRAEKNEFSNRYVWTDFCFADGDGMPFIGGESPRNGTYILNFFKCQPALNYGYLKQNRAWQLPTSHPDCIATREALKDIMRFWLNLGCDGFRVDMAASLVKNDDEQKSGTCAIWRNIREMLDKEYPDAAMVAEWNDPRLALKAGFHMDFYLNDERGAEHGGYNRLMRAYGGGRDSEVRGEDRSYFKQSSGSDIHGFLSDYLPQYEDTKNDGLFCLITCNHDTLRPRANLSVEELKLAYAFLFTMPGAPYLYYGDEIGMRYLALPTKEGGYFRTGSRTPMQWSGGKNLGFSTADAASLYLPIDSAPDAPTVSAQEGVADSLLNTVRALLALRHLHSDLQAESDFEVLSANVGSTLFVYRRGGLTVAVNPGAKAVSIPFKTNGTPIYKLGDAQCENSSLTLGAQSFCVIK